MTQICTDWQSTSPSGNLCTSVQSVDSTLPDSCDEHDYRCGRGASDMKCPSCSQRISFYQKMRFNRGIGLRQVSPCPHCGIPLIWAKWPHRAINSLSVWLLLGISSFHFFPVEVGGGISLYRLCTITYLICMIPTLFLLKLIVVSHEEK